MYAAPSTFLARATYSTVLTYAAPSTVLAPAALPPVLTDAAPSTLLALAAFSPMLTEATAATVLAPAALPAMLTRHSAYARVGVLSAVFFRRGGRQSDDQRVFDLDSCARHGQPAVQATNRGTEPGSGKRCGEFSAIHLLVC